LLVLDAITLSPHAESVQAPKKSREEVLPKTFSLRNLQRSSPGEVAEEVLSSPEGGLSILLSWMPSGD